MRNQRGITLIALVITVIILIILAGISISLMVGENGIIKKAQVAKENTIKAAKEEEEALNKLWAELESENSASEENGEDHSEAKAKYILSGYKAYSGGQLLVGTMINRGSIEQKLNAGESYTIPEGYHDGTGSVIANDLASQTVATATADNISKGKTAWVNGEEIIGNGKDIQDSIDSMSIVLYKIQKNGGGDIVADEDGMYLIITIGPYMDAIIFQKGIHDGVTTDIKYRTDLQYHYSGDILCYNHGYQGYAVYKLK